MMKRLQKSQPKLSLFEMKSLRPSFSPQKAIIFVASAHGYVRVDAGNYPKGTCY